MARRVGFWIAWYVPLVLLWLAFVDTLAPAEVVVGLVAAAIAATAADLVRSQDLVRFRLEPRWLRGFSRLPWEALRDCWLLTVALWRHCAGHPARGVFRVVPFPSEADDARSAARRALVTVLVSVAPNTLVVGVEGSEGELLIHQLVPEPGSPVPPSLLEDRDEPRRGSGNPGDE
ncbi:MAG TPA: Na+/H+ antiporter subunit E [Actinomycetota bacterium]|nr:Na+/H+ antiporter subunit E [Actinomycetota bacterium]